MHLDNVITCIYIKRRDVCVQYNAIYLTRTCVHSRASMTDGLNHRAIIRVRTNSGRGQYDNGNVNERFLIV